ncbi:hypothetical protein F2Q68_00021990 [Brassica cretica]|uniref:Uncharacterized protein n=1 Tax=Brassica cretica TaxID=69181 RepID=A0A8S9G0N0_BRACR|nr:hypothetical protein F2Q68_00021990 [Brassica cretica]
MVCLQLLAVTIDSDAPQRAIKLIRYWHWWSLSLHNMISGSKNSRVFSNLFGGTLSWKLLWLWGRYWHWWSLSLHNMISGSKNSRVFSNLCIVGFGTGLAAMMCS